jgi:hypothetical protein
MISENIFRCCPLASAQSLYGLAETYIEIDSYLTSLYLLIYINLLPATADLLARPEGAEGRHLFSFPKVSLPIQVGWHLS